MLHYDLGRGLRVFAGRNEKRLKDMVALATKRIGDLSTLKNDPAIVFALLDLVRAGEHHGARRRSSCSVAVIVSHASYLFPTGEPGRLSFPASGMAVTLLNWATSPHVKRLEMAFVLIDERRSDMSDRITGNPHVATIEVPMPGESERLAFVRDVARRIGRHVEHDVGLHAGAARDAQRGNVAQRPLGGDSHGVDGGQRLNAKLFKDTKKRLLERQCQGLLEFIEPKWKLDTVIGHDAAKQRLRDDAMLLARGALDSVPMGYLLCGPVGTGKSFLAMCAAGEIGIPCVMLKNFRSKYVGETEGNLERVLAVLRAMGPVMVVIDEADAALGDRDTEGDAGTSSRVFGMIATQMGDTRYRGRILWMLLTARPDLLPIDIKRQGRAEVHIPLFYPTDDEELREMFVMMAQKLGTYAGAGGRASDSAEGQLVRRGHRGHGGRAHGASRSCGRGSGHGGRAGEVVEQFMPSTQGLEKELQESGRDDRVHRPGVPAAADREGEWRRWVGAARCRSVLPRSSSSLLLFSSLGPSRGVGEGCPLRRYARFVGAPNSAPSLRSVAGLLLALALGSAYEDTPRLPSSRPVTAHRLWSVRVRRRRQLYTGMPSCARRAGARRAGSRGIHAALRAAAVTDPVGRRVRASS